jgi:hypothetical protein
MSRSTLPLPVALPQQRSFGQTTRKDAWWLAPLATFLGLGAFIVYASWAGMQGRNYAWGPYLSPMYSPLLWDAHGVAATGHAWFGAWPEWLTSMAFGLLPVTPAALILWGPGGFRFTCYYYRGAYYKAFWADPVSCAVGEPRKSYWGERSFPLILQNVHRYFLYVAIAFIGLLSYDAWVAMWFAAPGADYAAPGSGREFGVGVGTLVLIVNPILLGGYTFGCHSLRHLVGGGRDCVSQSPLGKKCYDGVSCLNRKHQLFAWMSLFWVGFTDLYVRLVAMGVWTDYRLL